MGVRQTAPTHRLLLIFGISQTVGEIIFLEGATLICFFTCRTARRDKKQINLLPLKKLSAKYTF